MAVGGMEVPQRVEMVLECTDPVGSNLCGWARPSMEQQYKQRHLLFSHICVTIYYGKTKRCEYIWQ